MSTSPRPTVSVVIPVHNEAPYLPGAIERLFSQLDLVPAEVDVIVAENGSTDGSADVVRHLAAGEPRLRLLELPTPDYGAAMRAGFLAGEGEWAVNFDIDYFSGEFLAAAVARQDADVVLASKRAPGSDDQRTRFRRTATWGFNLLLRGLFRSRITDTHGMKAVRRRVIEAIVPDVVATKDLFDTEMVLRAERAGFRIVELPVVVVEERASKSSLLRRIPRTLRGLWRVRRSMGRR